MTDEQTPAAGPSLLPCPFCGGPAERTTIISRDGVRCADAMCAGSHRLPNEGEDADALWNRRAPASSSSVVQGDASGVERARLSVSRSDLERIERALRNGGWHQGTNALTALIANAAPCVDHLGFLIETDDGTEWVEDDPRTSGIPQYFENLRPLTLQTAKHEMLSAWEVRLELERAALSPPAEPVSRPAGEGETTQHTPRCWGRTSYSDEMAHCYCKPAGEGEREAVAILKGIGKITGDGWKDTTIKGEIVFVWNAEKPSPYAPGQYPRIGNEGWSASTSQYDFTPATADDVPAILSLLSPAAPDAGGGEAWAWLASKPSMELSYSWGDEDEDGGWQVHECTGGRNDREWTLIASGETPLEAVQKAKAALQPGGER